MKKIKLNAQEIQNGYDRVSYAENLISQLPTDHEGRNTWLLNYGKTKEAKKLRKARGLTFDKKTKSCELATINNETTSHD